MGLAYDLYIKQTASPYRTLAQGVLKDTRYAKDGYFAIREVADVINQISGYTAKVGYEKSTSNVTLAVNAPGKNYALKIAIDSLRKGRWGDGNKVSTQGVYFTYYGCPLNSKKYISIRDLAKYLGLTFEIEKQDGGNSKTYNSFRFVGFGIQLELDYIAATGGIEFVFFTDAGIKDTRGRFFCV